MYPTITCSSSLPQGVRYMAAADSGYDDDHKLYNLSIDRRGFELVCPVSEIYNNTSSDRLRLIEFYESELGQIIIYSWRGISVEPLIEHIKDVFKIDPLPIRGYQKAAGLVPAISTCSIKSLFITIVGRAKNIRKQSNTC